jgi:hypothetical protein
MAPTQQVDAGGLRMMNNAPWIPERAVELQLLCAAKDETSVEFMRPLLNSWAECSVVISC